jgi:GNAT superfamily N-acetyltransferase
LKNWIAYIPYDGEDPFVSIGDAPHFALLEEGMPELRMEMNLIAAGVLPESSQGYFAKGKISPGGHVKIEKAQGDRNIVVDAVYDFMTRTAAAPVAYAESDDGVSYPLIVASVGGREAGYVRYAPPEDYEEVVEIENIQVYPAYRRRGIGRGLLEQLSAKYPDSSFYTAGATPLGKKLVDSFNKERSSGLMDFGELTSPWSQTDIPDRSASHMDHPAVAALPPALGTAPLPDGMVRMYHQTDPDNIPSIEKHGLLWDKGTGVEGPKGVWVADKPFYGLTRNLATIEVAIPKADREIMGHIASIGDIPTSRILTINMEWHDKVREFVGSNYERSLWAGEYDQLLDDPNLAKDTGVIALRYMRDNGIGKPDFEKANPNHGKDGRFASGPEDRLNIEEPFEYFPEGVNIEKLGRIQHESAWVDVENKAKRLVAEGKIYISEKKLHDPEEILNFFIDYGNDPQGPTEEEMIKIQEFGPGLGSFPRDEMGSYLEKIMETKNPAAAMRLSQQTKCLRFMMPMLNEASGFWQRYKNTSSELFQHLLHTLEFVANHSDDRDLRWAALLHDLGKLRAVWVDEDGRTRFREGPDGQGADHEKVGVDVAAELFDDLDISNTETVLFYIREHMFDHFDKEEDAEKFVEDLGGKENALKMMILRGGDIQGKNGQEEAEEEIKEMCELIEKV